MTVSSLIAHRDGIISFTTGHKEICCALVELCDLVQPVSVHTLAQYLSLDSSFYGCGVVCFLAVSALLPSTGPFPLVAEKKRSALLAVRLKENQKVGELSLIR
jgi:hypothetical protein